jgi:GNAT superfamily N-acetyltransferase
MTPANESTSNSSLPVSYRPGGTGDLVATHALVFDAVADLARRMGLESGDTTSTPEERAESLENWRPLLDHLAATSDQFWVAERGGELIGYARSILRDGVRELTEFFVSPKAQSQGVGRELLSRAMPAGASRTYIISTIDLRALVRYQKLGIYQICAIFTFSQKPAQLTPPQSPPHDNLTFVPLTSEQIPTLAELDKALHGHRRDIDHLWLMAHRTGFLLQREERAVGYGYVGTPYSGPFVLLEEDDFPAALAHAEGIAIDQGFKEVAFDLPMLNRSAIQYLLARGYQMSPFFCFYMCNEPLPHVGKTIVTAPMIMV